MFSFAIIALGIETLVCARYESNALGPRYKIIPVLPFLPAIPWLAYVFGTILAGWHAHTELDSIMRLQETIRPPRGYDARLFDTLSIRR
jgi:hypothetical protein